MIKYNHHVIDVVVAVLLLIGGLNWGFVGLFQWDLIGAIFGDMSGISRGIFSLVGLAALWKLGRWVKCKCK
jgi:uncharacterized membrane protein YuzA (DUF378 family)